VSFLERIQKNRANALEYYISKQIVTYLQTDNVLSTRDSYQKSRVGLDINFEKETRIFMGDENVSESGNNQHKTLIR
jgi:hypothetical protein